MSRFAHCGRTQATSAATKLRKKRLRKQLDGERLQPDEERLQLDEQRFGTRPAVTTWH